MLRPRKQGQDRDRAQKQRERNDRPNGWRRDASASLAALLASSCHSVRIVSVRVTMIVFGVTMIVFGVTMIVFGVTMIVFGVTMIVFGVTMIVFGVTMIVFAFLMLRCSMVSAIVTVAAGLVGPFLWQTKDHQDEINEDHAENRDNQRFV
jgi:membrane protein implicated in regulation of membrane protease activity